MSSMWVHGAIVGFFSALLMSVVGTFAKLGCSLKS